MAGYPFLLAGLWRDNGGIGVLSMAGLYLYDKALYRSMEAHMSTPQEFKPFTSIGLHNDVCIQLKEYAIEMILQRCGMEGSGDVKFNLTKDSFIVQIQYPRYKVQWTQQFNMDRLVDGLHMFAQLKKGMDQDTYNNIVRNIVTDEIYDPSLVTLRSNDEQ